MFLLTLLVLALPVGWGVSVAAAGNVVKEKVALLAVGAVLGLSAFVTVAYAVTMITPMHAATTGVLAGLFGASALALLALTPAWHHLRAARFDRVGAVMLLLSLLLAGALGSKLLFVDEYGLATGVINAWGDLGWHMSNITLFAEGQTVPPENPIFAGTRLTYPFLVNFFSGLLITIGASHAESVVVPALILMTLTFTLLYCLAREVAGGRAAGLIAVGLFITAGATLGWTRLLPEWQESGRPLTEFLLHLPRDYGGNGGDPDGYHFLNPILSLLLPQRSFLFGMPLAFSILLLLHRVKRHHLAPFAVAGLLAGLLPLWHAHTVLALMPALIGLYAIHTQRSDETAAWRWSHLLQPPLAVIQAWLVFALVALIVGLPEVLYYATADSGEGSFMRWGPGWTSGETNWLWHWLKNTGLLLPLLLFGLFRPVPRAAKVLALAGLAIFAAANLWLFAPWAWDNFKLLIFWLLFSLPLIGAVLVQLWQTGQAWRRAIVVIIVALQALTGTIDLVKTALPTATHWGEWDNATREFAAAVRQLTPRGSTILTAPYHNNPVALAGRPIYLGFPGHVWSHGGNMAVREPAVRAFYENMLPVLPDTDVQYVVVGPVERQQFPQLTVRPEWTLVHRSPVYELYQLPASFPALAPVGQDISQ